ncbi:MAG TPA: type IV pilus assembly protein PilM [Sedimentisphaerales bacterium]|nr:type IV pilus assembly protein PilM [Sedimentisphaerales bacterium]
MFEHNQVLGLDIGSSQVKLVQLRKDSAGYVVTAADIADIEPENGDKNHRETNTVRAIQECLESAGATTRMAVCGVSGPEVAVRCFKFPALPPEEVEGAVMLEAAQVCPFNVDDAVVEYQLIPGGDGNICGVLVAATNELIEAKKQLTRSASVQCVLMDVDGLALLNCFNGLHPDKSGNNQAGPTTAVLNVRDSSATLAIMGSDGLPFIRGIGHSGNDIVAEVAAENDLSAQAVRKILFGCEDQAAPEEKLSDSLTRACEKLIVDVTETLRYYAAQEKSATVEKVFVCGGFAPAKGFVRLLENRLPGAAVLWNPFDNMRCEADKTCKDVLACKGPALTVAAGLAMRSI